ncbi:MAG: type IV pilin [Halobacteriaceae archaeon]
MMVEGTERPGWSGDRWLTLVGGVIVTLLVASVGVMVLAGWAAPRATDAPNAEWDLVRQSGPYVSIVHAGGEPVDTDRLIVVVNGVKRQVEWDSRVIDDGDAGRVQIQDGQRLQLYFLDSRGDRVLLSNWVV